MTTNTMTSTQMQRLDWQALNDQARREALSRSPLIGDANLEQQVKAIIDQVASQGDVALKAFSQKFDKVELDALRLSDAAIAAASERVTPEIKAAIEQAKQNIETFHQAQAFKGIDLETQAGVRCELRSEPIEKVGLYIPGGSAPLISTVDRKSVV